jgi:hypothetical protein
MTFGKFFVPWIVVTVAFAVLAFLVTNFAPTRTLWPFGLGFLYIGVLILLLGNTVVKK